MMKYCIIRTPKEIGVRGTRWAALQKDGRCRFVARPFASKLDEAEARCLVEKLRLSEDKGKYNFQMTDA